MTRITRLATFAFAGCLLFAAGFVSGVFSTGLRKELIRSKYQGHLSHVSWVELFRFLAPGAGFVPQPVSHLYSIHPESHGEGTCSVLWRTPLGDLWGRPDDRTLLGILVQEQYLNRIYQQGPAVIRPGDIVLDAGANLGTFTRDALARGARLVVAFEPEPTNIECFKRSFGPEIASGRVILEEAALWETSGTLTFSLPEAGNSGTGRVVAGNEGQTISVRATTIDESVLRLRLDRVDFIKMDIEGAERHALAGGAATIAKFAPRMAIATEHKADDQELIPQVVAQIRPGYRRHTGELVMYFY